jgi:hypothetical protein
MESLQWKIKIIEAGAKATTTKRRCSYATKYPFLQWQSTFSFLRRYLPYLVMSNIAVSYRKQELFTLREPLNSPQVFLALSMLLIV